MMDLIWRLEAATEGSRGLDALIVVALDLRPDWAPIGEMWIDRDTGIGEPVIRINSVGRKSGGNVPIGDYAHYTTSLDAALTLVRDDLIWDMTSMGTAWVMDANVIPCGAQWFGKGASPALALCIAALRARNEGEGRA